MLKLKLQYFDHQMRRTDSLEKTLMLGLKVEGEGDDRGWDGWMTSPTRWTWVWVSSGSWWWTGRPGGLQSMGSQRVTQLSDWTDNNNTDKEQALKYTDTIYITKKRYSQISCRKPRTHFVRGKKKFFFNWVNIHTNPQRSSKFLGSSGLVDGGWWAEVFT